MTRIDVDSVLTQMRNLRAAAGGPETGAGVAGAAHTGFGDVLRNALAEVNRTQSESSTLKTAFEMGDDSVSLSEVMLASGKSQVAFRAATEVRNRLVSAYQDIMNMPV
ncbi:flagellar hook-basal body complex protein FliE [Spectribacter hydrogenoxidans]|nr:flagellar hook-basal body complex protein FliE [Salinisphaera sp. W335]MDT0633384.1 flagellar hook-basal body complex protein FliE [Salinisphaera sp. W335]